jgi:FkbM family methyltransferase
MMAEKRGADEQTSSQQPHCGVQGEGGTVTIGWRKVEYVASWKRRFANFLPNRFGLELVRSGSAWQLIESEYLRRFLSAFQIDCVFDVGANVGQYVEQLRHAGFRGLIISFEPNPDAVSKLREAARREPRWLVKEVALDSESRIVNFNVMKRSTFSSLGDPDNSRTSAFAELNSIERQISITTQTLSDIFPALQAEFGFSRPFLKMDTQGHDLAVAQGARACISQFVGLQSELSFTTLYKNSPDAMAALEYYRSLGFRLSSLIPNNGGHFPELYEADCIMYNPVFKWSKK